MLTVIVDGATLTAGECAALARQIREIRGDDVVAVPVESDGVGGGTLVVYPNRYTLLWAYPQKGGGCADVIEEQATPYAPARY